MLFFSHSASSSSWLAPLDSRAGSIAPREGKVRAIHPVRPSVMCVEAVVALSLLERIEGEATAPARLAARNAAAATAPCCRCRLLLLRGSGDVCGVGRRGALGLHLFAQELGGEFVLPGCTQARRRGTGTGARSHARRWWQRGWRATTSAAGPGRSRRGASAAAGHGHDHHRPRARRQLSRRRRGRCRHRGGGVIVATVVAAGLDAAAGGSSGRRGRGRRERRERGRGGRAAGRQRGRALGRRRGGRRGRVDRRR
jgi:hypothetical protein